MSEILSPAGVPLTAEEQSIICRRHPVIQNAILTPDGDTLADTWPKGKYAAAVMDYAVKPPAAS